MLPLALYSRQKWEKDLGCHDRKMVRQFLTSVGLPVSSGWMEYNASSWCYELIDIHASQVGVSCVPGVLISFSVVFENFLTKSQFAFALTGLGGRIAIRRPNFTQIPSTWTTPYRFLLKMTQLYPPRTWRPFNFLCARGNMREDMYIIGPDTEWDFWYYSVPLICK